MDGLRALGLVEALKGFAASGRPLLGICLGLQLLLESEEFGRHEGLGLIPGRVVACRTPRQGRHKIPNVGWCQLGEAEHGPVWRTRS